MNRTYLIPCNEEEAVHEVKKSRFIACSRHVVGRAQAMAYLDEIKARYPDARHYCWAFVIGQPFSASKAAMSDDGEPSGTAGKPILNVIQHKNIGDVMLIVVRYFGGIKLGAGGLTRAYSSAAQAVLSSMALVEKVPMQTLNVRLGFAQENSLRYWLSQNDAKLISIDYGADQIKAEVCLPEKLIDDFSRWGQGMGVQITKDELKP